MLISSCTNSTKKEGSKETNLQENKDKTSQYFPYALPKVPSSIKGAKDQAKYMLEHYWDKVNFKDKAMLQDSVAFEEGFANYFGLLTSLDFDLVKERALYPLKNSLGETLNEELRLYRKYLYEVGSPMINNEIYELVLNWVLATPRTTALQKEEASLLLKLITKNKVGSLATDFIYEEADGSRHHLKHLPAPYSLLVFAKSDCATCEAFVEQLRGNEQLKKELENLNLKIVLIYLDSVDTQKCLANLPKWVVAGFDCKGVILSEQLYDIKETPTFYLLKRGGKVLLKETFPDEVLDYLKKNL